MVELIRDLSPAAVAGNLKRIRGEIDALLGEAEVTARRGGRRAVEILAACKYVAAGELPVLHEAGVRLLGENRAQDLIEKTALYGGLFEWDFIGQLQSRKVRAILPHVRLIHSLASDSALRELERHRELAGPKTGVLIEVNVSGEPGKAGVDPELVAGMIERCPLPVRGLMTMPPLSTDPESGRPYFAALRELADEHGLQELSMGTSQDYLAAVSEGATIVRIGTSLYR